MRAAGRRLAGPRSGGSTPDAWAAGVVAVAVLVAVVVGGWVLTSRPRSVPDRPHAPVGPPAGQRWPVARPAAPWPRRSPALDLVGAAGLVVDVAGKVRHPGVYRLPTGARVADAVAAAGGTLPGLDPVTVNLARKLTDGEQLLIGSSAGARPSIGRRSGGRRRGSDCQCTQHRTARSEHRHGGSA